MMFKKQITQPEKVVAIGWRLIYIRRYYLFHPTFEFTQLIHSTTEGGSI